MDVHRSSIISLSTSTDSPHKQTSPLPSSNASDKSSSKTSEVGDDVLGDYVVGERVWVNGVKPGVIAYLGETQFAPGQWAGVVLNDLLGKNDGSVGGVRYFECQPHQGIFTRPSKLTRQPVGEGSEGHSADSLTAQNLTLHGVNGASPAGQRVVMPLREGMLNSSVKTGNESGSNMSDSGSVKKGGDKDLRVGDRVLVSPCPHTCTRAHTHAHTHKEPVCFDPHSPKRSRPAIYTTFFQPNHTLQTTIRSNSISHGSILQITLDYCQEIPPLTPVYRGSPLCSNSQLFCECVGQYGYWIGSCETRLKTASLSCNVRYVFWCTALNLEALC